MTVTVFYCAQHKKPSFTEVYRKIEHVRIRISTIRGRLTELDKAFDEIHKCIIDLEEVTKQ